jgi:hypothetical protein
MRSTELALESETRGQVKKDAAHVWVSALKPGYEPGQPVNLLSCCMCLSVFSTFYHFLPLSHVPRVQVASE